LVLLTAKAAGPGLKADDDDCREAMVGGIYPRSVCCAICDIKAFIEIVYLDKNYRSLNCKVRLI